MIKPDHPMVPSIAEIVDKKRETRTIFTIRLRFQDPMERKSYRFHPGQFNMVYAFGTGEVPISIVSDPVETEHLDHTIRIVGAVTDSLDRLKKGNRVGIRGPFGSAWPLEEAKGKDLIIVTGGLGCAPTISVINYVMNRREAFGKVKILHGVKTPKDLVYRDRFRVLQKHPDTEVYLTVDHPDQKWKYNVGVVTNLFQKIRIDPRNSMVMLCGPEIMMHYSVRGLLQQNVSPDHIYLSLERSMKCAVGFCGHCQFGPHFMCKDGPVFQYSRIREWFNLNPA